MYLGSSAASCRNTSGRHCLRAEGLPQELLVWLQVQIEIETLHCRGTLLGTLTLSGWGRRPGGLSRELLICLQVQIEIETMDRGGTFLGKLTLNGPRGRTWDLGLSLLEAGLGKLHPSFDADRVAGGRALQQAQEKAQSQRLKVCGPAPVRSLWGFHQRWPPPVHHDMWGETEAAACAVQGT